MLSKCLNSIYFIATIFLQRSTEIFIYIMYIFITKRRRKMLAKQIFASIVQNIRREQEHQSTTPPVIFHRISAFDPRWRNAKPRSSVNSLAMLFCCYCCALYIYVLCTIYLFVCVCVLRLWLWLRLRLLFAIHFNFVLLK